MNPIQFRMKQNKPVSYIQEYELHINFTIWKWLTSSNSSKIITFVIIACRLLFNLLNCR